MTNTIKEQKSLFQKIRNAKIETLETINRIMSQDCPSNEDLSYVEYLKGFLEALRYIDKVCINRGRY